MNDHASHRTVQADVFERELIDESLLRRLLQRAGRGLASAALDALELTLDPETPSAARLTMLAALSYLLMPADLIPDILPVAGFSDDLVALSAMVGLWINHVTPAIRVRARRQLDRWFPLAH